MRTLQFHMPHFSLPKWGAANGAGHRNEPATKRLRRFEGAIDYLVIGGVVLLAAAMVYGLLTTSGEAPWF